MPRAKAIQKDQFAVVNASGLGGAHHFSPRNGKIIVAAMVGNAPNARALARCDGEQQSAASSGTREGSVGGRSNEVSGVVIVLTRGLTTDIRGLYTTVNPGCQVTTGIRSKECDISA
jgi:hypothetical protein